MSFILHLRASSISIFLTALVAEPVAPLECQLATTQILPARSPACHVRHRLAAILQRFFKGLSQNFG
jgi:DNA-binding IscR family transcriptional regulator